MKWNCPHCETSLFVADEKLNVNWTFAKCYRCQGFSMVRRSDLNLLKVDGSPTQEQLLKAQVELPNVINHDALENLKHVKEIAKTAIKQSRREERQFDQISKKTQELIQEQKKSTDSYQLKTQAVPSRPTALLKAQNLNPHVELVEQTEAEKEEIQKNIQSKMNWIRKVIPISIFGLFVAGTISGIYFYKQGKILYTKQWKLPSKDNIFKVLNQNSENIPITKQEIIANQLNKQLATDPKVVTKDESINPITPQESDQLNLTANAPTREATTPAPLKSPPESIPVKELPKNFSQLLVTVQAENVLLRAGPGVQFKPFGMAIQKNSYQVKDWSGPWFKILISKPEEIKTSKELQFPMEAWVRNDFAQLQSIKN